MCFSARIGAPARGVAASNTVRYYEPRAAKLHETMGVNRSPSANEMEELKKISAFEKMKPCFMVFLGGFIR